ncbi:dTDP-4-dehydrorhamnose reductase [Gammaproteobacteria bacterium]|nr:dTDP-4-dehydrorhamnose reductase [Gammaproteobacteria bacterium]
MVIVIGKNGQLAQELKYTSSNKKDYFWGREDIDIFDRNSLKKAIVKIKPTTIVNTSAYTSVDLAETNAALAFALNRDAVKNLAKICEEDGIRLIHISTDFVFDGNKTNPYLVSDLTNPINVYGKSKLAGEEQIIKNMNGNYSIIRTSWLYSTYANNFVKTMIELMNKKNELAIVCDEISCPSYARNLSYFIWKQVQLVNLEPICHWTDLGQASWYEFAEEIYTQASMMGIVKNDNFVLKKIKAIDYNAKASRPKYSRLAISKLDKLSWKESLNKMLSELKNNIKE